MVGGPAIHPALPLCIQGGPPALPFVPVRAEGSLFSSARHAARRVAASQIQPTPDYAERSVVGFQQVLVHWWDLM
ncbi:hypothetical protein GCM10027075_61230 [Streptomyces heilongjiangensis]